MEKKKTQTLPPRCPALIVYLPNWDHSSAERNQLIKITKSTNDGINQYNLKSCLGQGLSSVLIK